MRLREAGPADAGAVAALLTASWQDAYRGLLPERFLAAELPAVARASWAATLAAPPPGFVLLAEEAGALRGFAALWLRGAEAYLDSLHVAPAGRGGGLGRRLLGVAMARGLAAGARHGALRAIEGNDGAIRFYLRLGGRAEAPVPDVLHGHPVAMVRIVFDDLGALVAACAQPPAGRS